VPGDGGAELRHHDGAADAPVRGDPQRTRSRHPAVLECAVVAIPDEKWGERPKAFVTLAADTHADEREIIDFCRERIAHFKAPAAVDFGPLPKTSTGKVQKNIIREREWADHAGRIN
jgi:fatty-acyl-CoA synthase